MTQEGDVLLFQTNDNGDILVENGLTTMTGGLDTAAYISLFGGNVEDDTRQDNERNWWGNRSENQPENRIRSETQHLIDKLPATSGNLLRIEDAVLRDLQWLIDINAASSITASVSIPGLNKVQIVVQIEAIGNESTFEFTANWKANQ